MLLYHGTTATILDTTLREGIRPRGTKPSLWPEYPSRPDCAYMTDGYAFYFAVAVDEDEKKVVFEIDTDRLDGRLILPDEDFCAQLTWNALRLNGREMTDEDREHWHKDAIHNLEKYVLVDYEGAPAILLKESDGTPAHVDEDDLGESGDFPPSWQVSLKYISTCCYKGTIPPSAITRYCVFDERKRPLLTALSCNEGPHLTPDCLQRNEHARNLTKWFFGDRKKLPRYVPSNFITDLENGELVAYLKRPNWDRESAWRMGVEVVNVDVR